MNFSRLTLGWVTGLAALMLAGCEDDGGGGGGGGGAQDFGSNDPNVVVAMGDSITQGYGGASYPPLLSALLGKPVVNKGQGGAMAADGAASVNGVLQSTKPGYLLILYGSNDAARSHDPESVIGQLGAIIQAAKANQTVPIIATLPPLVYAHEIFNDTGVDLSARIRQLASAEGVAVADVAAAFHGDKNLMQADGIHPNAAGMQVIANTFFDRL